jgi:DNA-binding response OmpR family regulator
VNSPAHPARPLAVLIVDDDPDCAETLADVLRAYGHDARTACTVTTAFIEAESFRPDALVMDIGIPGMDGYRLAGRLCEVLGRRPLLVALTGYVNLDDRSRQEGFDHHFVKPADPTELARALAAHARRGTRTISAHAVGTDHKSARTSQTA